MFGSIKLEPVSLSRHSRSPWANPLKFRNAIITHKHSAIEQLRTGKAFRTRILNLVILRKHLGSWFLIVTGLCDNLFIKVKHSSDQR
jgi:hypothetical protein